MYRYKTKYIHLLTWVRIKHETESQMQSPNNYNINQSKGHRVTVRARHASTSCRHNGPCVGRIIHLLLLYGVCVDNQVDGWS